MRDSNAELSGAAYCASRPMAVIKLVRKMVMREYMSIVFDPVFGYDGKSRAVIRSRAEVELTAGLNDRCGKPLAHNVGFTWSSST